MNTNQKGQLTEIAILNYIIKAGYSVSIPFGDKDRYDQIWDINGKLLRVQIKTCHMRRAGGDAIEFNCYSSVNGKRCRYSKEEIDYFATIYKDNCFFIPIEETKIGEQRIYIGETPKKNQHSYKEYFLF